MYEQQVSLEFSDWFNWEQRRQSDAGERINNSACILLVCRVLEAKGIRTMRELALVGFRGVSEWELGPASRKLFLKFCDDRKVWDVAKDKPVGALDISKALMVPTLKKTADSVRKMLTDLKTDRVRLDGMISDLETRLAEAEREISVYESMNSPGPKESS